MRDQNGDAVVHAIVRQTAGKHKFDCLLALLINSDAGSLDINLITADNNTALHLAVKVRFASVLLGEGGRGRGGKGKGGRGSEEGNWGRRANGKKGRFGLI